MPPNNPLSLPDQLPEDLRILYKERRPAIRRRLADFAAVRPEDWFYELAYCLLTPQSKAAHAGQVVSQLQAIDYQGKGGEVVDILRAPFNYIRFHNVKADRLARLRRGWKETQKLIAGAEDAKTIRDQLAETVNGLGMKEASHFLRNIGYLDLAIIDRHLITNLIHCGVFLELPAPSSPKRYRAIETRFAAYADHIGIPMDELDLLFWSNITGEILK